MTVVPIAASFVTQVWMARDLGQSGLGEYHATALFTTVLTTVLFMGFPSVAAQRIAGLDERQDPRRHVAAGTGFVIAVAFGAVMSMIAAWSAAPFARLFGLEHVIAPAILGLAVLGASMNSFTVHTYLARLDLTPATAIIVAQPIGVGAGIASRGMGAGLGGTDLAAIGFIVSGVVGVVLLVRDGLALGLDRSEISHLMRRSAPAIRLTYPVLITTWIDRSLVGILLGSSALGAFVAASALVETLQRFARAAGSLAVGAYARLLGDAVGMGRVLDSHLRLMAAAFIVAGAVFVAAGAGMLSLIYGPTFSIATTTLRLLSFAAVPMVLAATLATHSVGADLRVSGRLLFLLAVMHVLLVTVFTLILHIAGTAFANVVVWSVGTLVYFRQARGVRAPVQARTLLHIAGVSVPVLSAAWILGVQGWPWPLSGALAAIVAIVPVWLVLVGEPERRLIRRVAQVAV